MTTEAVQRTRTALVAAAILLLVWSIDASGGPAGLPDGTTVAYIGPGAGLSAIGAFLALVAAVVIAVFGFVWYPVKRVLRALGRGEREPEEDA